MKDIFSTIPVYYDFLNRFLSLRRDLAWRRFATDRMHFSETHRFLDVATGTADLAVMAASHHPAIQAVGLDFVEAMMIIGQKKVDRLHLADRIRFVRGDALALPFPDHHFDVTAIAFGIRNVPDYHQALKEMTRVTVRGGQIMVLEMHFPGNHRMRSMYRLYLNHLLPRLARLFSRHPSAYHYLADSIVHFPPAEAFSGMMEAAGLSGITRHDLTFGIACLHIGMKP